MTTVAQVLAAQRPDEIAVRDEVRALGWAELDDVLNRIANRLNSLDLGPDRRIAVFAENAVETAIANLGGLVGGASVVPVNFHLTAAEAAYILEDSGARVLFVGPQTAERGIEAAAASIFFWSLMTMACGLTRTYWNVLLARIGVGVGEATLSPATTSLVGDYFPREQVPLALSVFQTGPHLGVREARLRPVLLSREGGLPSAGISAVCRLWHIDFNRFVECPKAVVHQRVMARLLEQRTRALQTSDPKWLM